MNVSEEEETREKKRRRVETQRRTNLNGSDVTLLGEIHPVGFVELGSDEIVEIRDPIVLSHERGWGKGERGK